MPVRHKASSVRIRSARATDVAAILKLWKLAGIKSSDPDERRSLNTRLRRDRNLFLVAVIGSQLVGTLITGWDGWRGTMARLAVDPSHRRRGIAQRLVARAESRLRRLGAKKIGALVFTDNRLAARFWREVGYVPDSAVRRFVKNL